MGALAQTQAASWTPHITVNGRPNGDWAVLDQSGVLYATHAAFEHWQLRRRPGTEGISAVGQTWYALTSVPGIEIGFDRRANTLQLKVAQFPSAKPEAVASVQASSQPVQRLMPLEARVNGDPSGTWAFLDVAGHLHVTEDALEAWRLKPQANAAPLTHRGQQWHRLDSLAGHQSRLNLADQSVDLVFSPHAFAATRLATDKGETLPLNPSVTAAFVNYDFNFNHSQINGPTSSVTTKDLSALAEVGITAPWGLLTTGLVGRNLVSADPNLRSNWRRLETTFTKDFHQLKLSLRLGDSTTRAGIGSRAVYFGGLQLARNFALAPGFNAQPVPLLQGTSSAPSTVELYVNDALRQTSKVPTGPFALENFPLLGGSGQVRMVVRDVLGRETVLVQPFFAHSSLLEAGLSDWSFELGAVRENLGVDNANYGERIGSGLWRQGLNKAITAEASAQVSKSNKTVGVGVNAALPGQVLGYVGFVASRDHLAGSGTESALGLEYSNLRHGFAARLLTASPGFRQVGSQAIVGAGSGQPRRESAFNYSYSSATLGALGVGLAKISGSSLGSVVTASANYSTRIAQRASLTLSATRATGSGVVVPATAVGVGLSVLLDKRISSSSQVSNRAGQTDFHASVSRGVDSETGTGWRALAGSRGSQGYAEAGAYHQSNAALYSADLSANADGSRRAARLGLQSAWVWIDGEFHASRRVQEAFGIVEVPGQADVGVGFQGNTNKKTNASGRVFLPRLQAFQRNSVRLDPSDLPISAEIDSLEQVVVPAMRGAVKIVFPVRGGRAALIKIVLADGLEAPAGTELTIVGDAQTFFVARRGEAFLTGLQGRNTVQLQHNESQCRFEVNLPDLVDIKLASTQVHADILRLGPFRCNGVTR